ncbi:MAG: alanine--tRNA ligase [Oscillospiraceae bacterium]|nr:alanine--tRNA ligase [Oscillospiraceae bacterium]
MSKKFGLNELREMFLSFFESKGHLRLPSFSLIPQGDKSLLLVNSGMAPMKPWFTGAQEPPSRRVCTCQKCIRTGDIENIGHTARHGTFFEMLGNFSFGDYFKHEAIAWSWEFLTSPDWVGLDPDRLYPSIYLDDDEAFAIWHEEIGIPTARIFRFGKADNFWEHGAGPCGPCSEIYYDRGEQWGCGKAECTVGCDCDRYIEVWNNVFSQFNNDGAGNYTELAQKNIDTGMGLERLACVCQDVASLFDVDTIMNITNHVSRLTGAHYGQNKKFDISLRVITDHIRSATFMISDGVLPANEGRGYVLRRLLRRAARHGKLLGLDEPFLCQLCDTVVQESAGHYPELRERQDYITRVITVEEENFARTIDGGMRILSERLEQHKAAETRIFSGADAFQLYDTYGFPIDLTIEILEETGMTVDRAAFDTLMEAQKNRARKAREALGDLAWAGIDLGLDSTPTRFTGYEGLSGAGVILALAADGEACSSLTAGMEGLLVLDQTPFYAEMGGQVADHGLIRSDTARFAVSDVQKTADGKYLHQGTLLEGTLSIGDHVHTQVETARRRAIARAHSATHLLQAALRRVLGDHVHQAGSLVAPDHLRFDFTHFSALTSEESESIWAEVNRAVLEGYEIHTDEMSLDDARSSGATALFDEKYGDVVRVVTMGDGYSVELCGGTHLDNTAKVGVFLLTSEYSIASGVRRIEASTGAAGLEALQRNRRMITDAAELLKTQPTALRDKITQTLGEIRTLRHTVEKYQVKDALSEAERFLFGAKDIGGLRVITATMPQADTDALHKMGDFLRDKDATVVAVLSAVNESKITLLAVCGKEAIARGVKAGALVKHVSAICGGSGGGKPDSAMGGGRDILKLDNALAAVDEFVQAALDATS